MTTYQRGDDRKEDGGSTDVTRDLCHHDGDRGHKQGNDWTWHVAECRQELADLVRQPRHLHI